MKVPIILLCYILSHSLLIFFLFFLFQELFVSSLSLTSLFGALAAGRISDMVGRKRAMGFASLIFLAGSLIMAFSPNYGILMTGRVITGTQKRHGAMPKRHGKMLKRPGTT